MGERPRPPYGGQFFDVGYRLWSGNGSARLATSVSLNFNSSFSPGSPRCGGCSLSACGRLDNSTFARLRADRCLYAMGWCHFVLLVSLPPLPAPSILPGRGTIVGSMCLCHCTAPWQM
jgi:hypothetical protein